MSTADRDQFGQRICSQPVQIGKFVVGPQGEPFVSVDRSRVVASQTATTGGRKFDGGKLQYGLVPPLALKEMVKVLTFGAEKYEPDNWQRVPDAKRRYFDALQRHLWAWKEGEEFDPETGIHHLAHASCNLFFLYEHDVKYSPKNED